MKQERFVRKTLVTVIYFIIAGSLFLNYIKKDRISDEFILLQMRMFQHIRSNMQADDETLVSYSI